MRKNSTDTSLDKPFTLSREIIKDKYLFIMMIPGITFLIINNYIPMLGVIIAFKDINYSLGFIKSPWVGLNNFAFLFRSPDAFIITRNTLVYNAVFIFLNLFIGVVFAILLNEIKNKYFRKFYQSSMLLPYFLSMVTISYIVYSFLSIDYGFLNKKLFKFLGLDPVMWYIEPKYWPFILTIVYVWKNIGYSTVIYLAGITSIDTEYYDVAVIDGANKWHQIRNITIPLLTPLMVVVTLLAIGRIFYADFGLFYNIPMESGPLFPVTNVIDTYVYRSLITNGDIGLAGAAGFYQSLVGFGLVIFSNWFSGRINRENVLF